MPCPKIDVPKSKKAKSKKPEIEPTPTPTPTPPVKTVSCSIEFRIYLDEVERITQAFLINLLVEVRKTGQQYASFFKEELASMVKKDSIRGPLRYPIR
jgi:hypothetical protein